MARILFVVDSDEAGRNAVKAALGRTYIYLEAGDIQEAKTLLFHEYKTISAVVLCLRAPAADGLAFLAEIRRNSVLAQLPVVALDADGAQQTESDALQNGASDWLSLPYPPENLKQRIHNLIELREKASVFNAFQRDKLTGLLNREAFFERAAWLIRRHPPGFYVMAIFDVESFKVINDQYGMDKGDEMLQCIADVFSKGFEPQGGICCRIMADDFAVLYPRSLMDTEQLASLRQRAAQQDGSVQPLTFSIGRYIIDDLSLSVSAMYDRAVLAQATVKGRYDKQIALYDESMRANLLHRQRIVSEMSDALASGQFEAWFQPQYNHATGALIGAETLVRWRHPTAGLIRPDEFVPLFERNGFIYEMDKFIWECACRAIRRWMDGEGTPLPLSVNVSRYDIFREDLTDVLLGLIRRYDVPADMLRLEITESAFTQSAEQIIAVVRRLLDLGFIVEIDDFGSGYSSLNTLKDVPAQILKLDMRFLENTANTQRGGNILESVVRMAKWLGMSVIAEGVETAEQADFLKSVGCFYIQGYLYAKPLPLEEYEALVRRAGTERKLNTLETVHNLDNNAFWDPQSMDTLIFNSFVGGACIYEFHNGKIELLRANDKYIQVIGSAGMTIGDALHLNWAEHLSPNDAATVMQNLHRSIETQDEITGEYLFLDLPGCPRETYLRSTMRVIASADERYLVYCTNENVTELRHAQAIEQEARQNAELLRLFSESAPCAIAVFELSENGVRTVYHTDGFYSFSGYTKTEFDARAAADPMFLIHPADRQLMIEKLDAVRRTGAPYQQTFRCVSRDGGFHWFNMRGCVTQVKDGVTVLSAVQFDVTEQHEAIGMWNALLDNLPVGAALYAFDGETLFTIYRNRRYWTLVHRKEDETESVSCLDTVHPDDRAALKQELLEAIRQKRDFDAMARILYGDGDYMPFHMTAKIVPQANGMYMIYASYIEPAAS